MQTRNYSQRSIHSYVVSLASLAKYCNCSADLITIDQLKEYLNYCISERKLSVSLINQCISAFKILQQDVLGRPWEAFRIKRPRRDKKLPVILSKQEVKRLIDATPNLKHRAILALGYSAGLRRGEVLSLMPKHIDSDRMQIRVESGKGNKTRYTILSKEMLDLLRLYYKIYKPQIYLFEGHIPCNPYSERSIETLFNKSRNKAQITKQASFHSLRHCFATHLLEQGVNLRIIQDLLGHTSLKTTSIYLHICKLDAGNIASPFDSL
jgi:site-specific recombinase XerD